MAQEVGELAGDGLGHHAAVAHPGGEVAGLVDAEVGLQPGEHGLDEVDVLAAGVGPAVLIACVGARVEPLRDDEYCVRLSQL